VPVAPADDAEHAPDLARMRDVRDQG
jgi:hypothetical protein